MGAQTQGSAAKQALGPFAIYRSPCSGQRSAAERGEPPIRKKQAGVTRGNAGSSVEGTRLKQPLNYIEAPSRKASSKNDTEEFMLMFFCYVLCSRNQISGSLHLVEGRC